MIKIGITCREEASIWSNGLDQNIYFFVKMFRDMGYDVSLVSELESAKKLLDEPIKFLTIKNVLEYDLILEIACPISTKLMNSFNSKGRPIVTLKLGNNFFIDLENMIHKPEDESRGGTLIPYKNREIWISPHFERYKDYLSIISRTDVKVCPYVWDPCILDMQKNKPKNIPSMESLKKIAIIEPNLNIVKTSVTPLVICELVFNKNKNLINEIYCFNSKRFENKKVFIDFISSLNIHNKKISSYENRISINEMFYSELCGTIVSHQLYNELNYAYFEAIYYNRLLVHNSPFLQDAGYYYPEHDAFAGAEQLEKGIADYYNENQIKESRKYLDIYGIKNKKNQDMFRELIEGVL